MASLLALSTFNETRPVVVQLAAVAQRGEPCIAPSSGGCGSVSPGGSLLVVLSVMMVVPTLLVVLVVVMVVVAVVVVVVVVVVGIAVGITPPVVKFPLVIIVPSDLPPLYFSLK